MIKIAIIFILIGFLVSSVPLSYSQSDRVNYFYDELEPGGTSVRNLGGGCIPTSFTQSVHMWRDVSGQVSSWVIPQKLDWGFVSPGECMETTQWGFKVPENTKPGTYTFEWIEQCEPLSIPMCNTRNIEKFEVTVIGSAPTPTFQGMTIIESTVDNHIEYARSLVKLGSYQESIIYWDLALEMEPNNVDVLDGKGGSLYYLDKYEESIIYYDKALAIEPNNAFVLLGKAISLINLERYDEAIILADKVLATDFANSAFDLKIKAEAEDIKNSAEIGKAIAESKTGGCLIATATFGSELAPQVQQLREIRDNSLLQTESGSAFMESFNQFYYSFSPTIADLERENPVFKEAVKLTITPLLFSLSLLNYVNVDSESEVLGYGISLILLNVGMYFVAPAVAFYSIRNRLHSKNQ